MSVVLVVVLVVVLCGSALPGVRGQSSVVVEIDTAWKETPLYMEAA